MTETETASADDLHRLVALASVAQPSGEEGCRSSNPIPSCPTYSHSPDFDKGPIHILDALALLCVKAKGDVFAVAAQMVHDPVATSHKGEIVLTIAGNAGVPGGTAKHISDLWSDMKQIAYCTSHGRNRMAADRAGKSRPCEAGERQPTQAEVYERLSLDVYRFSFDKFYCSFKKGYGDVKRLINHLKLTRVFPASAQDSDAVAVEVILSHLAEVGEICGGLKGDGKIAPRAVDNPHFLGLMDIIWCFQLEIFGKQESLSRLKGWALAAGVPKFLRYLRKVVEFHYAIMALDGLARSQRRFHIFLKELKVVPLAKPDPDVQVGLPKGIEGWREVLNKAMLYAGHTANPASEKILQNAVEQFSNTPRKCPVHCEVSIIEYFSVPRTPPPANYIGVSKLSCVACTAVIKQWSATSSARLASLNSISPTNAASATQFVTKGCNGKWCFGWGFPASANMQPILDSLYQRASEVFGEQLYRAGYAGLNSSL